MRYLFSHVLMLFVHSLVLCGQVRGELNELWNRHDSAESDSTRLELLVEEIGYSYEDFDPD